MCVGGWQFTWFVHPADLALFGHVKRVPAGDTRARHYGHTTVQKYLRIRTHTVVLALTGDAAST